MEWNQPRLAEFGVADRQNAFGPVDVGGSQIERFADAQAGHCQYAQQAVMCPWPQAVRGWQVLGGFQELTDLLVGIEIWFDALRADRQ